MKTMKTLNQLTNQLTHFGLAFKEIKRLKLMLKMKGSGRKRLREKDGNAPNQNRYLLRSVAKFNLVVIPIRVQKRNFELRPLFCSIQRDKLFPIHSDFENYTLERELV